MARSVDGGPFTPISLDCFSDEFSPPAGKLRYEISVIRKSPTDPAGIPSPPSDPSNEVSLAPIGFGFKPGLEAGGRVSVVEEASAVGSVRLRSDNCPQIIKPGPGQTLLTATTPGDSQKLPSNPTKGGNATPPPGQPPTSRQPAGSGHSTPPLSTANPGQRDKPGQSPNSATATSPSTPNPPAGGASPAVTSSAAALPTASTASRSPSTTALSAKQTGSSLPSLLLLLVLVAGGGGALLWLLKSMNRG